MGSSLGQPGQERPADHGRGQKEDRSPQGGQRPVVDERIGDDGGDQPGLGDDQQGSCATDDDGENEEAPGGRGVVQQAGVEGAAPAGVGGPVPPRRLSRWVHSVPSCCVVIWPRTRQLRTPSPAFFGLTGASR